jgi:ribosome-binding protein aMBF1 (putative translation factor)
VSVAAEPTKLRSGTCPRCGSDAGSVTGAWLRWKREQAGLSIGEMAEQLRVSKPFISMVENERCACPLQTLRAYEALEARA